MKKLDELKEYVLSQLEEAELLEIIEELNFSPKNARDGLGVVLAELHNEGKIDFLSYYRTISRESVNHDFFTLKIIFEKALPTISSSIEDVIDIALNIYLETQNDILAPDVFISVEEFLINDLERPNKALEFVLSDQKYLPFVSTVLKSGAEVDLPYFFQKTKDLFESNEITLQKHALYAFGLINYQVNPELLLEAFSIVTSVETSDVELCPLALSAAIKLSSKDVSLTKKLDKFSSKLFISPDRGLIHIAAEHLWRRKESLSEELKVLFFNSLKKVEFESKGTLDFIDYVLDDLVKAGNAASAIELLEEILCSSVKPIPITVFNSFVYSFRSDSEALGSTLVKWLASNQARLWKASFDLIGDLDQPHIILSRDSFESFAADDFIFLGRKIVGWFYMNQEFAARFLLEIMRISTSDVRRAFAQLLYDPMLVSYASVAGFFKDFETEDQDLLSILSELQLSIEGYKAGIASKNFKEIQPSTSWRSEHFREQKKRQEEVMKSAESKSIVLGLFSKQVLLYGGKSINYIQDGNGNMHRQETPLTSFSHSIEIPRLSFIDPHGLDLRLRIFRNEENKV